MSCLFVVVFSTISPQQAATALTQEDKALIITIGI